MSSQLVRVHGVRDSSNESRFQKLEDALEKIRQRAFSFLGVGENSPEQSVENWLNAERELFQIPDSEIYEGLGAYTLIANVRGFNANQLDVIAEPNCITLQGKWEQTKKTGGATEVEMRDLFRRFELKNSVQVANVKATLDNGILTVVMPIGSAEQAPEKVSAQTA